MNIAKSKVLIRENRLKLLILQDHMECVDQCNLVGDELIRGKMEEVKLFYNL